jgi:hypothetical protein
MAKEFYSISYKTYYNERLKTRQLRGRVFHPLYIQMTYDRRTLFFKSNFFDLFTRPKYDFLSTTLAQIEELENRVIDTLIDRNAEKFNLDGMLLQYKVASQDILDSFDGSFKSWLAEYCKEEGLPGIGSMLEYASDEVSGIRIWDDLQKILDPERFANMEDQAVRAGPYLPVAMYVRHTMPKGPFCFPLCDWTEKNNIAVENFIDERFPFPMVDFNPILKAVQQLFQKGMNV